MAVFNVPNYLAKDGFGMSLNIRRGNPNPLDNSSVWSSYDAALNYAQTDPVAYVGQILTVVTDVVVDEVTVKTATAYVIDNEAGDLKEVGSSPVGDESTVTVAEDGTVSLYGIAGLALTRTEEDGSTTNITYQPLLVNGKLTWVEPSATTVEGLATEIEGLKTRISAVETTIGKAAEGENEATGLIKSVADIDARLATAEGEIDTLQGDSHTHENADVLNGITADKVSAWDSAEQNAKDYADSLAGNYDEAGAAEAVQGKLDEEVERAKAAEGINATAAANALAEAQAKVASVTAGDASVIVGGTATAPTVAAKLSADADNALELAEDGLKVVIPAAAEYSVVKDENSGDYAAIYHLTKDGVNVGAAINIPKDMVVESGAVVENPEGQTEGTYIKLVLQNVAEPLYINVGSLIEYVTSGSAADDIVVINISDDHKVTASIADGAITLAKLSTEVQTAIGKAHTHENADILAGIDADKVAAWDAAEQNAKDHADGLNTAMNTRVEALEAIDHEHSNKDELDKIQSGDKAKWDAAEQNAKDYTDGLNTAMDARVKSLEDVGAEKNVIASVDPAQFAIDDNRNLTLLDVAMGKVTGLTAALEGKVDKAEGSRLLTSDEATKLEKLVLGENGEVSVSGKVAAGNVEGLDAWITARAGTLEGLSENNLTDALVSKINGIEEGAQVNKIEAITLGGVATTISNKTVDVPVATLEALGLVKSSEAENKIAVAADGTMEVNSLNVNKLVQDEGSELILNGGAAAKA